MGADELLEITKMYRQDFTSVSIEQLQLLTVCLLEIERGLKDKIDSTPELEGLGYTENMSFILESMGDTVHRHICYVNDIIQYKVALGLYDDIDAEKIMVFDLQMIASLYRGTE